MGIRKQLFVIVGVLITPAVIFAQSSNVPKQSLKANYQVVYNDLPGTAGSFGEMFSDGRFYGRLRSNNFYFHWKKEDITHSINTIGGLGGSIVFRSAEYKNFDFGLGIYASRAYFNDNKDPIAHIKPGKDMLSRFKFVNDGSKSMVVPGQLFINYTGIKKTDFTLGRQLVDTFYTKSNDSKMIPNTFDGLLFDTETVPATSVKLAYLTKEKLRDHTTDHSVLVYGDANATLALKPQWSQNDDSAMHRGLTYTALKEAGISTDEPLITGDIKNRSIDNLKADFSFYAVPNLLSQAMAEFNYIYDSGDRLVLIPGVRYIRQFDNGAGAVGGASYCGPKISANYKDPNSLDAEMIAARVVGKYDDYNVNLAFTYILDKADLVTPWRGFPTAGYTRSMGIYNWRANTKSYRLEVKKNTRVHGIFQNLFVQGSILYVDGDESKGGYHNEDRMNYYLGFIKNISSLPSVQLRLRLGYTEFIDQDLKGLDYLDSRFEINYLF